MPPVTWVEECDFTDVDLSKLVALTLEAVAAALEEVPELNARLEGNEIVYLDRCDLGVAVQTEQGLVVPVVRECRSRSVDELASEVARLAEAARAGELKPEELRGSTFTVTSAGKAGRASSRRRSSTTPRSGSSASDGSPSAPVVRDGEITVRQVGYVSVTFDHRVVDGARAAQFGLEVIDRLQSGVS